MWKCIDYGTELYHHGVKGMKWGVRHDRPKSLRNLRNQIITKPEIDGYKGRIVRADRYDRRHISKGTEIQNISLGNKGKRDTSKAFYASYKDERYKDPDKDTRYYRYGDFANILAEGNSDTNLRVSTYASKKNLKSPSLKTAMKELIKMYGDTPVSELGPYTNKDLLKRRINRLEADSKNRGRMAYTKDVEEAWEQFIDRNDSIRDKYFERIQAKGYDFITDYNDLAIDEIRHPVIILDPKKSLKLKKTVFE